MSSLVSSLYDRFQCLALVLEIAFGCLYQIGNQVIATFELHVNLSEGVFEAVSECDQSVVDTYDPEGQHDYKDQQDTKSDENLCHDIL